MRPIVLFLTVWLPVSAGAMELGSIPTPATRMQRGTTCTFAAGQAPRCSDGRAIDTARAGMATCLDGTTATANKPCVSFGALECFAAGFGDRTAGDMHTISTAGWPTTGGKIAFRFRLEELPSANAFIFDGRATGALSSGYLLVASNGRLQISLLGETPQTATSGLVAGRTYGVELRLRSGFVDVVLDGSLVGSFAGSLSLAPVATLGSRYTSVSGDPQALNGSISRLSWSSK